MPEVWEEGSAVDVGLGDYEASRLGVRSDFFGMSICVSWERPLRNTIHVHPPRHIILVENGIKVRDS